MRFLGSILRMLRRLGRRIAAISWMPAESGGNRRENGGTLARNSSARQAGEMKSNASAAIRYEADETPPGTLVLGLGLQLVVVSISPVVLLAAIVFRAGGAEESLLWGVFAAVLCCGVSTILQALRIGRVGAGYVIFAGTSSTTIAISVTALAEGGPAMLATLVVVSGVVLIVLSARLSLLRRVLTPTVAGTVIMLMPVTVMPNRAAAERKRRDAVPRPRPRIRPRPRPDRPRRPAAHRQSDLRRSRPARADLGGAGEFATGVWVRGCRGQPRCRQAAHRRHSGVLPQARCVEHMALTRSAVRLQRSSSVMIFALSEPSGVWHISRCRRPPVV